MTTAGHRRGAARRAEIASSALAVFLEHGYAGTSIRMVAERAGCSLETIYRHFQNKEGLFVELVGSLRDRIVGPLTGTEIGAWDGMAPEAALARAGEVLLAALASEDGLKMQRLTFAEAGRFPELGRFVYEGGIRHVDAVLAQYLAKATSQGLLRCADPEEAARSLSGLLLFDPRERLLLGIEPAVPDGDVPAYVARMVRIFLDGMR